jgi:hypothetical protein
MRGLAGGELQSAFGIDVSQSVAARAEAAAARKQVLVDDFQSNEGKGDGPFIPPESGFGAFDGNFTVEIEDEERKAVSLRGWATELNPQIRFGYVTKLMALFMADRYDFLFEERDSRGNRVDRLELIANIYDYIDSNQEATDHRADPASWGRRGGGSEDSVYSSYERLKPRNAYFDSASELKLVHGFSEAHWRAFREEISIYGENKTNILSAGALAIEALVRMCAMDPFDIKLGDRGWMQETLQMWGECKMLGMLGGCQLSPQGFATFLDARGLRTNADVCQSQISLESKNFTVRVTATVNDVARTTAFVARVHGSAEEFYYYSVR